MPPKADDVGFGFGFGLGHCAPVRQQQVANLQVFKVTSKCMRMRVAHSGTANMLTGHSGQRAGRALNGGALQLMLHRTQASQLFAAT